MVDKVFQDFNVYDKLVLSDSDFTKIKNYIEKKTGIRVSENKKILIQTRLLKRLKALKLKDYSQYCKYAFSGDSHEELINLIDCITTNKTDFFREINHFNFLYNYALPYLFYRKSKINIWSAACSSGEEPYSIAMVVQEYLSKNNLKNDFLVFGTDISTRVLKNAIVAIYPLYKIKEVPREYRKYFLKSKDPTKKLIRISPEIRKKVKFGRFNLLDDFKPMEKMDIIFCRNVFIYFEKIIQENILKKFFEQLNEGGFLFVGHSETFQGLKTNFKRAAPSIYIKED